MDKNKPHKGHISNWEKRPHSKEDWAKMYPEDPPVLGYIIVGRPSGHPVFENFIRTSPVVKHEGNEIETLNSRYTLV